MRRYCVRHASRTKPMRGHTREARIEVSREQDDIPDAYHSEAPQGATGHPSRSYSSARGACAAMLELTGSRVNGCTSCYPYSIALRHAPRNDRLFTEFHMATQVFMFVKNFAALIIRLSCTGVKIHLNKKFGIQPIRQAERMILSTTDVNVHGHSWV